MMLLYFWTKRWKACLALRASRSLHCSRAASLCSLFGCNGACLPLPTQGEPMQRADKNNTDDISSIADLALLFTTGFYIGDTPIQRLKTPRSKPFWVRYEIDGWVQDRTYLSVMSWRALMLYALLDRKTATVHEMDERGRLARLFPAEVKVRLNWNANARRDLLPVARFYDPNGSAELILTRSRCFGHAVDVLHNLTEAGPVFQSM
ncbi:hypothetical protein ACTDI4_18130 [Mesorhizobium sp. PUT5]|uniref:hypothetical protein n=1 Tax=Mesorhizobium sp. PUT5 TaxID=3454629 RepID=UPI003FA48348